MATAVLMSAASWNASAQVSDSGQDFRPSYSGSSPAPAAPAAVKHNGNRTIHYKVHYESQGAANAVSPENTPGTAAARTAELPQMMLSIEAARLIEKGFYSTDLLASAPFIAADQAERERVYPADFIFKAGEESFMVCKPFDELVFVRKGSRSFSSGDSVDLLEIVGSAFSQKFSNVSVLRRLGWGIVMKTDGKTATVCLEKVWDILRGDIRLVAHASFPARVIDTIVASERAVTGHVARLTAGGVMPMPYEIFIADVGSNDGISLGDIFSVFPGEARSGPKEAATACAINVRDHFCTLAIITMASPSFATEHATVLRSKSTKFK